MKKVFDIIWGSIIIAMSVILIGFFALLFVPQMVNDAALKTFSEEIVGNLTMSENSEMVEYISGCGNTSGTGNHVELYVAILIKSSLDKEELLSYYKNDEYFLWIDHIESYSDGRTIGMVATGKEFDSDIQSGDAYYILEYSKSAPLSWLDIRGA